MSGKSAKRRQKQQAGPRADLQVSGGRGVSYSDPASRTQPSDSTELFAYQHSVHVGPLPAPETMREYGEIVPGAPDRIIAMWERQSAHRQRLENRASWTETLMRPLSLLVAVGLAGGFGYIGWDLIKDGRDLAGMTGLVAAIATLAGIFMAGRKAS